MKADETAARTLVKERSRGRCEVGVPNFCTGWGQSMQHRKPRGMGGSHRVHTAADLLSVCGDGVRNCHGYIESHRAWSLDRGLIVPQHCDVEVEPVLRWGREWVVLRPDGSVERTSRRPASRVADGAPTSI